jgi:hypothetical protein
MKTQIAKPKLTGGLKSKQDAIDEMNKYFKALELWGKFKMFSRDEEAVSELATAKASYESAQASAGMGAGEEEDSDGSVGGY